MKRKFTLLLTILFTLFTLPVSGLTVLAAEKTYDDIEDGEYDIKAHAKQDGTSEASIAADYMSDDATLTVKNGETELTLFIPDNPAMNFKQLEVAGVEPTVTPGKLDGEEGNFFTYNISMLQSILKAVTTYEVPMLNLVHENVKLDFHLEGLDELPVIEEEPEEPVDPEDPDNGNGEDGSEEDEDESDEGEEGSEENEEKEEKEEDLIQLDDGFYTIDSSYFKTGTDDNSSMGSYLDDSVFVSAENGTYFLTITINEDETVTKLQVDENDAVETEVDGEKRYETFEMNDLASLHSAYVEYQAPFGDEIFEGQADFDIALDPQSVTEAQESDKPGFKEDEDVEEDPAEDPEEENDENTEGTEDEEEPSALVPDKVYTIDYDIYDDKKEDFSVANQFFTGEAILLEKDGKTYAQLVITDGELVKSLSNKYDEAILVKEEEDGSIVMQLRVDNDLSDMLLDMHIVVPKDIFPGFPGYDEDHQAYLVFDTDTKKEKEVEDHKLAALAGNQSGPEVTSDESTGTELGDENDNNGNGKGDNDDDTPEKPEFGTNGDGNGNGENGENGVNPQTGDTSMIMLYALLLLASLVPLGIQLKRRFAVK